MLAKLKIGVFIPNEKENFKLKFKLKKTFDTKWNCKQKIKSFLMNFEEKKFS